jgi:hypothetical protein
MVNCTIEHHYSSIIVHFDDGKSTLIQSDYDQAAFAVNCGLIQAPQDWDGCPDKLGQAWIDCDLEDIENCPEEYYSMADDYEKENS